MTMNKLSVLLFCLFCLSCQETKQMPDKMHAIGKLLFSDTDILLDTVFQNKEYRKTITVYNPQKKEVKIRVLQEHPEIVVTRCLEGIQYPAEEYFILSGQSTDSLQIHVKIKDTSPFDEYPKTVHFEVDGDTLVTGIHVKGI